VPALNANITGLPVIVYSYSGSLNVTFSPANVRLQGDDLGMFLVALFVIFGGGSFCGSRLGLAGKIDGVPSNSVVRQGHINACNEILALRKFASVSLT